MFNPFIENIKDSVWGILAIIGAFIAGWIVYKVKNR